MSAPLFPLFRCCLSFDRAFWVGVVSPSAPSHSATPSTLHRAPSSTLQCTKAPPGKTLRQGERRARCLTLASGSPFLWRRRRNGTLNRARAITIVAGQVGTWIQNITPTCCVRVCAVEVESGSNRKHCNKITEAEQPVRERERERPEQEGIKGLLLCLSITVHAVPSLRLRCGCCGAARAPSAIW